MNCHPSLRKGIVSSPMEWAFLSGRSVLAFPDPAKK
jgi:hypothetical protein